MNKVTRKEFPTLFKGVGQRIIEDSYSEHRRGSNFFTKSIIEFTSEDDEFYPEIPNFSELYGYWETNQYIHDDNYGTDWSEVYELTRVIKEPVVVTTFKWVEIKDK